MKEDVMTVSTQEAEETLSTESLIHRMNWRYATKKFDASRKIPASVWSALEQALVLAPSSFGLQPWKFIVVQDPALRAKLQPASWNQSQIVDASHLVVFTYKKDLSVSDVERFVKLTAKVRGVPEAALDTYKQMMVSFVKRAEQGFDINAWASDQLYIALGTFLTAAAVLGVDACPMEGIEPQKYDEILGLEKEGCRTAVVATAGYRADDDKYAAAPKVRYPASEIIAHR
jgi:nitroreductase